MIKEHNNLNVENLVKTEWFNQFNEFSGATNIDISTSKI